MKPWFGVSLLIAVLAGVAAVQADDRVNEKQYGNCYVLTLIDAPTDEEIHVLICGKAESLMGDETAVALSWTSAGAGVVFSAGPMFHLKSRIDVAWQIDNGAIRKGNWHTSNTLPASTEDRSIFQTLLNELPAGKRMLIKVGIAEATISLDGSAAAAKDFRARIAMSQR